MRCRDVTNILRAAVSFTRIRVSLTLRCDWIVYTKLIGRLVIVVHAMIDVLCVSTSRCDWIIYTRLVGRLLIVVLAIIDVSCVQISFAGRVGCTWAS